MIYVLQPERTERTINRAKTYLLLVQLHHHIRYLDIFLRLILRSNLENNILLVTGNWLSADMFNQLTHPEVKIR